MKLIILVTLSVALFFHRADGQCPSCSATSFTFDLSPSVDTTVTVESVRNGDCCTGTNCIRFNLTINPACSYVNLTVINPAPSGSAYYQINCGPQTSIGVPVCIVGMTSVCITYCKPGNDAATYIITAAGALQGSPDITVREGCTGKMGVKGLLLPTINWTSIYPGATGAYNSWLNCTAGCDTVTVSPLQGAPPYIDYQVSGNRLCGGTVYDTIRVFTQPKMTVAITPPTPSICPDGSGSVTLTATPSGGDAPYSYTWNTGAASASVNVNMPGTYSVTVSDTNSNCSAVTQQVVVNPLPNPPTPIVSANSPLCAGGSLQLVASYIDSASYSWTGPNGFTSSQQNPVINNVSANNAGTYTVSVTINGCTRSTASTNVIVNAIPPAPTVGNNGPVCAGNSLMLSSSLIAGASYSWTGPNSFSSSLQNPVINNIGLTGGGLYSATATVNGCTSVAATTNVVVNPLPATPVLTNNGPLCSGTTLSLTASSDAGATYSWTGPSGFSAASQNPTILNVTTSAAGIYTVTPALNGCAGGSASTSVVINATPGSPIAGANAPICEGSDLHLTATSITNATYNWTGPNSFSSSSQDPVVSNAGIGASGVYLVSATVNGCTSSVASIPVMVNAIPQPPAASSNGPICEGSTLNLLASFIANANYNWAGPNGFSSNLQNPSINNAAVINSGSYVVTATVNGCTSAPSSVPITVNSIPLPPVISANSPVCTGNSITLSAETVADAIYSWWGPNGFSSASQDPVIAQSTMSNGGIYSAVVTVNGCTSPATSTNVTINPTPPAPLATNNGALCEGSSLALSASSIPSASYNWSGPNGYVATSQNASIPNININNAGTYMVTATVNGCTSVAGSTLVNVNVRSTASAGPDQSVCVSNNQVNLNGTVSGGANTGVWSSSGSGSFVPSNSNLLASYVPSAADRAAGSVQLSLQSTNNGACAPSTASMVIAFQPLPFASAGSDTLICANTSLQLNGSFANAGGITWSSTGSGSFSPSNSALNAVYIPSLADTIRNNVTLTLRTTENGNCAAASSSFNLTLHPPPHINAGADRSVIENSQFILSPLINEGGLRFLWSPPAGLNSDTAFAPLCKPGADVTYIVTVWDQYGCSAKDDIAIKVLKLPVIPNVFTPNGDGINEAWQIKHLSDFTDCDVEIFNRYGQLVFQSTGYSQPWDGKINGKPAPAATYYFIINLKHGLKPLSGFVDIVR